MIQVIHRAKRVLSLILVCSYVMSIAPELTFNAIHIIVHASDIVHGDFHIHITHHSDSDHTHVINLDLEVDKSSEACLNTLEQSKSDSQWKEEYAILELSDETLISLDNLVYPKESLHHNPDKIQGPPPK